MDFKEGYILLELHLFISQQADSLHEKIGSLRDQVARLTEQRADDLRRLKEVEEDKIHIENRLQKTEVELSACQAAKEGLRRDKAIVSLLLIIQMDI